MKTLFVLILSIFFYSTLTTATDGPETPIICNIVGDLWQSFYVYNLDKLPERCDIYQVSQYTFDLSDGVETYMYEADKKTIKRLVQCNKIVYVFVGLMYGDYYWESIFDPENEDVFKNERLDPLVAFINEHNISGISINYQGIYDGNIEKVDQKISDFVTSIKKEIDNLKVGLVITGASFENYSNPTLFDFTITNEILDHYIISFPTVNECNEIVKSTGLNPITSTDEKIISMEKISNAVQNSNMDKSKVYALLNIYVIIPVHLLELEASSITSYSEYCGSSDVNTTSQWCKDCSKPLYDQGAYAKKFFAGLMLANLDTDDYDCSCQCQPFPVTNIIIDGWKSCTFTDCPKLN